MSSRHLRRAKDQLSGPVAKAEPGEEEASEASDEEAIGSAKPFNPFDLLSDGDADDEVREGIEGNSRGLMRPCMGARTTLTWAHRGKLAWPCMAAMVAGGYDESTGFDQ